MNQHDPIFFTVPSGDTKRARILHKGGGGGGDGGAAAREEQRQARIAAGTNQVNQIFGIGNDPAQQQRTAMYDSTRDGTRQFFSGQLAEDSAKAEREMNFQKARQGIIGSSQANDLDTDYQKRYDRGLLDVANRADGAANQFRTSDEAARLSLISKVVSGLDTGTAAQNALNTLQTNQAASKDAYQSQRMGNVFSDLLGGYNQQQFNNGIAAGKNGQTNQYGNFFANNDRPVDGTVTVR